MYKKVPTDMTPDSTRHTITIVIQENIKPEFPDQGRALVSVEHTRKIHGESDDTVPSTKVDVSDLLNIAANLISSTIIESDVGAEDKLQAVVGIAQDVVSHVLHHTLEQPSRDHLSVNGLTEDQQASLQLFLSNPMLKYPVN